LYKLLDSSRTEGHPLGGKLQGQAFYSDSAEKPSQIFLCSVKSTLTSDDIGFIVFS